MIVDDEPLARRKIRSLLAREKEFEIVGECSGGRTAVGVIKDQNPDLVFLDVQMPGMGGFEVVYQLPRGDMPLIVFVTAYDQYAVQAFECSALDYLLKPVDRERFAIALERAKCRLRTEGREHLGEQTRANVESLRSGPKYLERLAVKANGRVLILKTEDIDWIEAEGKYVRIHIGGQNHLLREAISFLDARLDPSRFFRAHRSAIVNLDRVTELQPWFNGDYRVLLKDGTSLTLSRSNRKKLGELVGNRL